jgi:hypothetical protein
MKYAFLSAPLMLAACAQSIDAPSLLPRPAESADVDAPAAAPPPPTPGDPAQAAIIAKLLDQARQGDAAFQRALPGASTNAAPLSEAWIAAQNARSAVDIARGPTLDALSSLDAAIGEAIDKGQDTAALAAARTEVQSIYDRQSAKLDALIR